MLWIHYLWIQIRMSAGSLLPMLWIHSLRIQIRMSAESLLPMLRIHYLVSVSHFAASQNQMTC